MLKRWVVTSDWDAIPDELSGDDYQEKILMSGDMLLLAFVQAETSDEALTKLRDKLRSESCTHQN